MTEGIENAVSIESGGMSEVQCSNAIDGLMRQRGKMTDSDSMRGPLNRAMLALFKRIELLANEGGAA